MSLCARNGRSMRLLSLFSASILVYYYARRSKSEFMARKAKVLMISFRCPAVTCIYLQAFSRRGSQLHTVVESFFRSNSKRSVEKRLYIPSSIQPSKTQWQVRQRKCEAIEIGFPSVPSFPYRFTLCGLMWVDHYRKSIFGEQASDMPTLYCPAIRVFGRLFFSSDVSSDCLLSIDAGLEGF